MRLDLNGTTIGYDIFGEGETALALLHAYPLSRGQWAEQAQALAKALAVQVVIPDLRGCGESFADDTAVTMERMAQDIVALLDSLGARRIVLGGLSLGGYVAFAALRAQPDRFAGVILADTRASADTPEGQAARAQTAIFVQQHGAEALFDRDSSRLLSNRTLHHDAATVARARALAAVNRPEGLAAVARGMARRQDASDLLPHIGCPTLILVGDQDELTPIPDARFLFERIPHAKLEIIEDAGHLSNLERPARFTDRVGAFLRERLHVPNRAAG